MWTPKRILILVGGSLLFLTGFVVYSFFFGGIDGLPALPAEFGRSDQPRPPIEISLDETAKKIAQAYGPQSEEARLPFRLDLGARGIVLVFDQFDIEPDGRVKLTTFSAALFGKKRDPREVFPEITTVTSETAFLTLDKAVQFFTEITNRRIIGVELRSSQGVKFVNNRRTEQKNDDIDLRITYAPVNYEESSNKIWSEGFIKLLDLQTQPDPTQITAKGLELFLAKESPAKENAAKATKGKGKQDKSNQQVSGVEKLVLKSYVDMHLWVDAQNGFLANPQDFAGPAKAPPQKDAVPEKAHVIIKTNGPFRYEMEKEVAHFDAPAPSSGSSANEQVLVSRENKVNGALKFDQLICDKLVLHFRRIQGGGNDPRQNKEIDTADATARPGREVVVTMDTENLEAYGSRLFYRAPTETSGPQTILEGAPLHAIREGHKIWAQELHLIGADKKGNGQQAYAKGPGKIDMLGKSGDTPQYTMHALWKDSLIATKDKDGDRIFDLLTFTGDAEFIDDEHKQALQAQRVQIWLEQIQTPQENRAKATNAPRQKPHRVEAYDRVAVQSPDLIIDRCRHRLVVCFRDKPAIDDRLPDVLPAPMSPGTPMAPGPMATGPMATGPMSPGPMAVIPSPVKEVKNPGAPDRPAPLPRDPKDVAAAKTPVAEPKAGLPGAADKDKPRRPITLSADNVLVYVNTQGTKKQLDELVTDGDVHVTQEGEVRVTPEGKTITEKGVDITGEQLNLVYHPLGNKLYVIGDARRPAELQLNDLIIVGYPKVTINQKDNIAEVDGAGAMTMPSNTTFDGAKTAKPGSTVTIHWNQDMAFDGKFAEFHGGVQAFQDDASLKCQTLRVSLDRMVSLKEGQKAEQKAKIEKLVCDQKVFLEEHIKAADGRTKTYKRLVAFALAMDNQDGPLNVSGPGKLYQIAPGGENGGLAAPNLKPVVEKPVGAQNKKLQLTRVDFEGRMFATNTTGAARTTTFNDNVEVYNQPGDDPDVKVDPTTPPKDGFYMRSDTLKVTTIAPPEKEGKGTQHMVAEGNVTFRTPEFYGQAKTVKYDEGQDTVIFEGRPAILYKLGPAGAPPDRIDGDRILYNRRTGTFHLDGGKVINLR